MNQKSDESHQIARKPVVSLTISNLPFADKIESQIFEKARCTHTELKVNNFLRLPSFTGLIRDHNHNPSLHTDMMTKLMNIPSSTPRSSSPDNVWLSRWNSVSQFDDHNYLNKKHFQSSHYISSCSSVSTVTTRDDDCDGFDLREESEDETFEKWLHSSSTHSLLSGCDEDQHSLPFHYQNPKRSRNIQINTHDLKSCPPKRQTSPLMRPTAQYAPNFNFEFSTGSFPPRAYSGSVQKSRRSLCATLGVFKPLHVCHAANRSGSVGEANQDVKDEEESEELVQAAHASPSRASSLLQGCSRSPFTPFTALKQGGEHCSEIETCDHLLCLFDLEL